MSDDIDRRLRQALADNLPPAVREHLRTGMRESWRRSASGDSRAGVPRWAVAAAALLMIAVGGFVHLTSPKDVVAEPFSRRQEAIFESLRQHVQEPATRLWEREHVD